ncbi:hypothetical protein GCM10022222_55230 [Amycolatopsis ultiminotia]|uniref:Asparagine synthetase domain-containing protein n=1 Tax=Amycolatopsis ultiminotia TaxID=543629 RepID=A0ABP6XB97_9PSEU
MESGWYFVVFPDCERARPIADRFDREAHRVIRYPSGRPMVLAKMPADQLVAGGTVPKVAIGLSSATPRRLARSDVDSLAHALAGSFHLVAAEARGVRVQGSASGLRRVHHAVIDGVPIASDRADVLAGLGGFGFDERALAIRLLRALPHPLSEEPLWRGVTPVPPDSAVVLDADGRRSRTVRWWRRPDPVRSRAEGAVQLRAALAEAVAVRTAAGATVHCDLSGGLDSTPICYLAAQGPATIVATTMYNEDPGGKEDLYWARRALPAMPGIEQQVGLLDDMPNFFEGMPAVTARLDEPTQAYLTAPRIRYSIRSAQERGARLYLTGLGGDHLLHGLPVWDHTVFRRRPLHAWRRIRLSSMLQNRSLGTTLRELLDNESYRGWLSRTAGSARRARQARSEMRLSWDQEIGLPRWLTEDATAAVLERIQEIAEQAQPLGETRAAHAELAMVRDGTRIIRGTEQYAAALDMPFASPFFDDRVVEACFAVRHEERDSPMEFKPLIKAAMRDALPAEFLKRGSKMGGSTQAARGLAAHWPEILGLCEDSPLAALGIVDFDVLARSESPEHMRARDAMLDDTVNCAVFLRNHGRSGQEGRDAAA